jgi:hypothetical protein
LLDPDALARIFSVIVMPIGRPQSKSLLPLPARRASIRGPFGQAPQSGAVATFSVDEPTH